MIRRVVFDAATKSLRVRHELPGRYGRYADSTDLFALMGMPRVDHWPATGLPARDVQGVRVWVNPKPVKVGRDGRPRKSSAHRVRCACPGCGRELSAGRLSQHLCEATEADRQATLVSR